jgi:ABC-type transport system involved in multi-copper enzyme maturation permease subunit
LFGPIFNREVVIAPRRARIYIARTAYVAALAGLAGTAWAVLTGMQTVREVGDFARFGALLFQILAPLQLALAVFFSATLAASAVAQEKDRRTLVLLLLTHLSNTELVLGKLMAALLGVLVMLAAAVPLLVFAAVFGGVSLGQIGRVLAVTVASVVVCGSLGSTVALWRDKTFQSLATTLLVLVLWLALGEVVAAELLGRELAGISASHWAIALSPWRAVIEATRPYTASGSGLGLLGAPTNLFLLAAATIAVLLNGVAVAMVRRWNPSREAALQQREEDAEVRTGPHAPAAPVFHGRTRQVWDNPVLWREVRTRAYGRRVLIVRIAFAVLFAVAAAGLHALLAVNRSLAPMQGALALVPLALLGLVLVNAQAVTSLTSERDVRALDLLLVTDLTPKEIVFSKLAGVIYNAKEMVLLPMLLCGYLWFARAVSLENLLYLLGGLVVLDAFVAMLGIHVGMTYSNSRQAIATSLGTVFFLFLGVVVCMQIIDAFSGNFQAQLQPFLAFMIGGGIGLFAALGARNPSTAIGVASFACPFFTFYAITSFYYFHATLAVFLVTAATYGFTTAAMLVPAIYEFDVATGRTTGDE